MIRRLIVMVALGACAGGYALAAERATFILTDGERKSGPVVFHTDSRENLINGNLNLGTDNGKELTFPIDQVAVMAIQKCEVYTCAVQQTRGSQVRAANLAESLLATAAKHAKGL